MGGLHSIYVAVRDKNWGTIEPRFLSYEIEAQETSFQVRFVAQHMNAEVDFVWEGAIKVTDERKRCRATKPSTSCVSLG